MDLDFSVEQKAMRAELRRFLAARCGREALRAVVDSSDKIDRRLWREVAELGVPGLAIPEAWGGSGAGDVDQCAVAEEFGRSLAPLPLSASIHLAAGFLLVAGSDSQKSRYLPELAAGRLIGTFAFAEGVGPASVESVQATVERGRLQGTKLPVPDGAIADFAIVVARDATAGSGRPPGLYLVDLGAPGVARRPVETIDLLQGHARLEFSGAAVESLGTVVEAQAILERVLDRAAVLTAFEQLGGADRSLELARDHALDRQAFGRPIGSFQAIKHRLADLYVAATLARSNAYYAAWALATAPGELPRAAATARVSATDAFLQCSRESIQVHGGMGFTWDLDCHLYYRRANAQGVALGGMAYWEQRLIDALVANAGSGTGGTRP